MKKYSKTKRTTTEKRLKQKQKGSSILLFTVIKISNNRVFQSSQYEIQIFVNISIQTSLSTTISSQPFLCLFHHITFHITNASKKDLSLTLVPVRLKHWVCFCYQKQWVWFRCQKYWVCFRCQKHWVCFRCQKHWVWFRCQKHWVWFRCQKHWVCFRSTAVCAIPHPVKPTLVKEARQDYLLMTETESIWWNEQKTGWPVHSGVNSNCIRNSSLTFYR